MKTTRTKKTRQYIVIFASLLALLILYNQFTAGSRGGYSYRVPEQTNDGWEVASLADVGMDEAPIVDMMNALSRLDEHPVHGIVVIKDGRLVFEEYFSGEDLDLTDGLNFAHKDFDRDSLLSQASASKSVSPSSSGSPSTRAMSGASTRRCSPSSPIIQTSKAM